MTNKFQLNFDEFIRSAEINKNGTFTFLLGAGASINSNIQSAYDCIWEWKTRIFFANNPHASTYIENYKLEQNKKAIQKWLDSEGTYLPLDDHREYSFYIEKCYPIEDDRRAYFQSICEGKSPSIGYKLLCSLAKAGIVQSVWTTNFDNLTVKTGVLTNTEVIDISLDSVDRINRAVNKNELLHIGLHGDYRYGALKNTTNELREQDDVFRERLVDYLVDKHLVVIGYSGRDKSLMEALSQAYKKNGGGRLYWCGYGSNMSPEVEGLLRDARESGRPAFFVPTDGFDTTLISLSKVFLKGNEDVSSQIRAYQTEKKESTPITPFSIKVNHVNKVVKSNAFPISLPKEAITFEMDFKGEEKPWKEVRGLTEGSRVQAVPFKELVWAFGTLGGIEKCFSDRIKGKLVRQPLSDMPIHRDTAIYHLMLCSLTKALAQQSNLQTNGRDKLWHQKHVMNKKVGDLFYFVHQGVRLSIKFDTSYYLTLVPDFTITSELPDPIPDAVMQEVGKAYFEKIYNKQFNDYINDWRKRLFGAAGKHHIIEFPPQSASGFSFRITRNPAFAQVMEAGTTRGVAIDFNKFPQYLLRYSGIQYKEPKLIFSPPNPAMKETPSDFHPMRGLLANKPFDYYLNQHLGGEEISICVICPEKDKGKFYSFINKQNQRISSNNINANYLLDYPSFYEAYKTSMNIPNPSSDSWVMLQEPHEELTIKDACQSLATNIREAISTLRKAGKSSVIVVYIPQRWNPFLRYTDDKEYFDLHDYIKAYAAPSGITTQFIKQETVESNLQCQIHWSLSLSFYVKSFRTPWVLNSLDKQTAFAGLGYSIDKTVGENHIVLGCSHIYNSMGEGLKYKLSKVEEPVWDRQNKPHLSYNDAFKFGITVRELFFESMRELPKRVVIHKRTYFTEDEINGIKDSLYSCGIEKIDLIEVTFEDNIKYVASKIINNAPSEPDSFPLSRGTTIPLNNSTALLWTHGVVPSVAKSYYKYYLGGRYIPSPLRLRKHYGDSNIGQIANEILGLSKMNWNSYELYTQLPATITSSNEIARIGKLLTRIKGITYDYRCFM